MLKSSINLAPQTPIEAPRVLAYCHDGVGLGHLRRTLNICEAVGKAQPLTSFLIASGSPYTCLFQHGPRLDFLKLPALTKIDNDTYSSKYLSVSSNQLLKYRQVLLLETAKHYRPDIVLVDKAPVGVRGELAPTLRWLRTNRPDTRIIFGMRDIDDVAEVTIRQWAELNVPAMLETCFDEIWVYGSRSLFDVAEQYGLSNGVRRKLQFMGYLTQRPCKHSATDAERSGGVLVTVGGGTDGSRLIETYLAAAAERVSRRGLRTVLVGGPDLPNDRAASLRAKAASIPNLTWLDFEPCMMCRIREARLVVSMGGYNTLCEIALNRSRALIIPRTRPRLEQSIRARLWSQLGIVDAADPTTLTPEGLADHVLALLDRGDVSPEGAIDLRGLDRVLDRFNAFRLGETSYAAAVSV